MKVWMFMTEIEYQVLEADTPAPAEQLEMDFGKFGWILQTILPWKGKLIYYFIKLKN